MCETMVILQCDIFNSRLFLVKFIFGGFLGLNFHNAVITYAA